MSAPFRPFVVGQAPEPDEDEPRIVGLCEGYGGLTKGVQAVLGGRLVAYAEIKPAAVALLADRHPGVPNLGDLTTADWSGIRADIVTVGWPCQPHSAAGLRLGEEDVRAIWPEVVRVIGATRPLVVVGENVARVATNGELRRAVRSLAAIGYVGAWRCIGAGELAGAPHKRDRLCLVAIDATVPHAEAVRRVEGWARAARVERGPHVALGGGGAAGADDTCPTCGHGVHAHDEGGFCAGCGSEHECADPELGRPGEATGEAAGEHAAPGTAGARSELIVRLPTPGARDHKGAGWGDQPGRPLSETVVARLLPTPEEKLAHSGPDYARAARPASGGDDLTTAITRLTNEHGEPVEDAEGPLLPTPMARLGEGHGTPDQATAQARYRGPKSRGGRRSDLDDCVAAIEERPPWMADLLPEPAPPAPEGERLLPTHRVSATRTSRSAALDAGSRSSPSLDQALEIARGELPREFESWEELPPSWQPEKLLPTPAASSYGTNQGGAAGRVGEVRESLDTMARRGRFEDEDGAQDGAQDGEGGLLPTPTANHWSRNETAQRSEGQEHHHCGRTLADVAHAAQWGVYAPAIRRWELVLGRRAPSPTQPGHKAPHNPQLSPAFVEWMMGLPEGWVTAGAVDPATGEKTIGLNKAGRWTAPGERNAFLSLLGDGVVPQWASAQVAHLLPLALEQAAATTADDLFDALVAALFAASNERELRAIVDGVPTGRWAPEHDALLTMRRARDEAVSAG